MRLAVSGPEAGAAEAGRVGGSARTAVTEARSREFMSGVAFCGRGASEDVL